METIKDIENLNFKSLIRVLNRIFFIYIKLVIKFLILILPIIFTTVFMMLINIDIYEIFLSIKNNIVILLCLFLYNFLRNKFDRNKI
jgi:hypothetical protein